MQRFLEDHKHEMLSKCLFVFSMRCLPYLLCDICLPYLLCDICLPTHLQYNCFCYKPTSNAWKCTWQIITL